MKTDALTARFSALGLMNICTLIDNHKEVMFYKSYEALIELAAAMPRQWIVCDSLGEIVKEGGAVMGADEPLTPRSQVDSDFVTHHG